MLLCFPALLENSWAMLVKLNIESTKSVCKCSLVNSNRSHMIWFCIQGRDSLPSSLRLSMEDFCVTPEDSSEYHIKLWPLDIHRFFFFLMKFIIYSRIATFSPSQGIGGECPAALLKPCKLITKFFVKTNDNKCALNQTLNYSFFFPMTNILLEANIVFI